MDKLFDSAQPWELRAWFGRANAGIYSLYPSSSGVGVAQVELSYLAFVLNQSKTGFISQISS